MLIVVDDTRRRYTCEDKPPHPFGGSCKEAHATPPLVRASNDDHATHPLVCTTPPVGGACNEAIAPPPLVCACNEEIATPPLVCATPPSVVHVMR